jgi:AraC family transcriptional regulator
MRIERFCLTLPHFIVRDVAYAPGTSLPRHAHEVGNISTVVAGEIEETTDFGEQLGRSCSVVVKPAGTVHANRVRGRAVVRILCVELNPQSPCAIDLSARRWQWLSGNDSARAACDLYRAFRFARSGDQLEALVFKFVEAILATPIDWKGSPLWFEEACSYLRESRGERVRFNALARRLGLHPVYLSRAFRRHAGVSMTDYLRSLRLSDARHLLSSTQRPSGLVAHQCGFADSSHLCRMVSRSLGVTPRQYRRLFSADAEV